MKETGRTAVKTAAFNQVLLEKGYRLTPQRQAILEILIRHSGQYLDGDTIYSLVKRDYPNVGIATIYRTLALLEKLGLLSVVPVGDQSNRYRLQLGQDQKCRLICRKCGQIQERPDLAEWLKRPLEEDGFLFEETFVYGTCPSCLLADSAQEVL